MAKNIQFKIVLIFFIIGITIISGLGIYYINSLNTIQAQIGEVTVNEIQQFLLQCFFQNLLFILLIN